jgi:DNA primase
VYRERLRENPAAIGYLKSRGLDGDTTARFQIGYAPAGWDFLLKRFGSNDESRDRLLKTGLVLRNEEGRVYDRFRDRIIFPIRDSRGRTVGFGGRVMDQTEPKYLNSPETPVFHKGRELYGLFEARRANRKLDRLIVVEGYMDVVALARHGITNAVATLGTATTPDHLQRLFRAGNEIIFCFDGDRAGREAAWRALQVTLPELREGRQVRFLFLADGQDPDSMVNEVGPEAFAKLVEQSDPLSEYLLEHLKAETDLGSMDGQARLAELARPLVNRIPEGVYRELLLERLATEVGLSAERLTRLLSDAGAAKPRSAEPVVRSSQRVTHGRPGPVRQAVTLVLHQPSTASLVRVPEGFDELDKPGLQLLRDLLAAAEDTPDIKPARLAESLADHPDGGGHLTKLLTLELPLDEESDWEAQLQDTLDGIVRDDLERRFAELADKANHGLTDAEKAEFRELQEQIAGPRSQAG